MLRKICTLVSLFASLPMLSQVAPSSPSGIIDTEDDTRMITPPAVSGDFLPQQNESGLHANYLNGGVIFNGAYISNVQPGVTSKPIDDYSYSIWPSLTLDQRTQRTTRMLTYSSGFTFYQKSTDLDSINQSLDARFDYEFSNQLTFSVRDALRQNSNVFNQPLSSAGGSTSPPAGAGGMGVAIPFEEELMNNLGTIVSYQYDQTSMLGGKFEYETLHFPAHSENIGLLDSHTVAGLGFYSKRMGRSQYAGGLYRGGQIVTSGQETTTQTHTFSLFYTFLSDKYLTISLAAGPEHMSFTEPGALSYEEWAPWLRASFGWQAQQFRFITDYSRDVTSGQGILGAYATNTVDAAIHYRATRNLTFDSVGAYENDKNSVPALRHVYPGGHTISWTASAGYNAREYLMLGFGYTRLHQSYSGISNFAVTPDSNRVFTFITYYFHKPLGK